MWAIAIVTRERLISSARNRIRSATARTTKGMIRGSIARPVSAVRPRKLNRLSRIAIIEPRAVAATLLPSATITLFVTAWRSAGGAESFAYHARVKPLNGNDSVVLALIEKTNRIAIGRYRRPIRSQ